MSSTFMVAMRDGVCLATDVYLPPGGGPAPVLLERTPYGRDAVSRRERTASQPQPRRRGELAREFAATGYAVVVQDCRGRHGSEGTFTKYIGEASDGADTLAWIRGQPWCNGDVAAFGMSYSAHTQTALASQRPAGLRALFLEAGGFSNAYRGGIRHGGAFELKQATWALRNALDGGVQDEQALAALRREDIRAWFHALPWARGRSPLQWAPEYEDYLFQQWERGNFDDYWRQPELYAAGDYAAYRDVPTFLMCGWWDPYAQTTTDNYAGIAHQAGGRAWMVLGPWTHGERSVRHAGDVDFGPAAVLDGQLAADFTRMRLEWFDRWLRPDRKAAEWPRVRYFRMGGGSGERTPEGRLLHGGSWQAAADWPVPGTQDLALYLHADGTLSSRKPQGESVLRYEFDSEHPVPTLGGSITSGEPLMFPGAYDQSTSEGTFAATAPYGPLAERDDVLVFQTEPLAEDLEVTGTVLVRLWISSSAPDTDFTAKLVDVYPPSADWPQGFAMNLTDGILRCRYRRSWERPQLLEPGEIAEITIEPMPTSNLFRKGHRIRLDVSSSNFPRFDVNPNTGAPEGSDGPRRKAINAVHVSGVHASRLVLPVVP
ncbi:CocE/NonD family hydrolase [Ramlibacter sp. G-1-2-2]|uniref:CocE/NonD family hydrolase n=1 Tax=Ramlibacter agri TaxID=2728837 RepID=A0A848GXX2_9BURK|nr:CocE/NonD family hydrolase [Ramlibacter agri]NML42169.1 CocE/NonD family hydrolase [Ramlibacter agri]